MARFRAIEHQTIQVIFSVTLFLICGLNAPADAAQRRGQIHQSQVEIRAGRTRSLLLPVTLRPQVKKLGALGLEIVGDGMLAVTVASSSGEPAILISRSSKSTIWTLNGTGLRAIKVSNQGDRTRRFAVSMRARRPFNGPGPTPTATVPAGNPTIAPTIDPTLPGNPVELGIGARLGGRIPFPADNPWNQDISNEPVDPNSATLIASIGSATGLHPDFGTFWEGAPIGIPYVVVSGAQARVSIDFRDGYPSESDGGPVAQYPIPPDAPVEGGSNSTGDRHVLVIDRDDWRLYELFAAFPLAGGNWRAMQGSIFNLSSNELRPAGWTSADAAGLPIFPGLVRYDEVMELGEIKHALRFTAARTRRAYVHPARHYASSNTSPSLPPMGMRVRLKAGVDISSYSPPVQVILRALKKYGMFLADNGSNWYITGAHDPRWNDDALSGIRRIRGSDLEVVQMGPIVY